MSPQTKPQQDGTPPPDPVGQANIHPPPNQQTDTDVPGGPHNPIVIDSGGGSHEDPVVISDDGNESVGVATSRARDSPPHEVNGVGGGGGGGIRPSRHSSPRRHLPEYTPRRRIKRRRISSSATPTPLPRRSPTPIPALARRRRPTPAPSSPRRPGQPHPPPWWSTRLLPAYDPSTTNDTGPWTLDLRLFHNQARRTLPHEAQWHTAQTIRRRGTSHELLSTSSFSEDTSTLPRTPHPPSPPNSPSRILHFLQHPPDPHTAGSEYSNDATVLQYMSTQFTRTDSYALSVASVDIAGTLVAAYRDVYHVVTGGDFMLCARLRVGGREVMQCAVSALEDVQREGGQRGSRVDPFCWGGGGGR